MNETLQTIHHLKSIREFTDEKIKQEDLDTILEASIRAANASARQGYSIVVLTDAEKMKAVCGYVGAAALIYLVDSNRLKGIAEYMGEKYKISPTIDFITGSTDAVLAAQTAVIAAKSLGIDALITNGVHRQDFSSVYEILKLPKEYCFPVIGVVLGYSKHQLNEFKGRVKTGVIHYDQYHPMSSEEIQQEMNLFDTSGIKYGVTSQWEAAGFSHYYEWFFRVWTGEQQDKFLPVLKETKFFRA